MLSSTTIVGCLAVTLAGTNVPRIAVLDAEMDEEPEANVQEAITAGLARGLEHGGSSIVDAKESCSDAACMRAVAERLQASHVARARISRVGTDYAFELELVDATSGATVQRVEGSCEICTYQEAAESVFEHAQRFEPLESRAEVARVALVVNSNPVGASVQIDGTAAGMTPFTGELEPGEYEVAVTKPGYEAVARRIRIADEPAELDFDLLRTRTGYRPGPAGYAGWAVAATGLAALVGGVALIAINERSVKRSCSGEHVDAAGNCEFLHDTLAGGVTMTVLGALGMGVGAGLVIWDHKRERNKLSAGLGLDGFRLQGRF